jgi:Uma2 family endonuclease
MGVYDGQAALLTAADLEKLAEDGKRYELVRGVLITMPPSKPEHGEVLILLAIFLGAHVMKNDLGRVVGDSGFLLTTNPDTVRAPDIAFTQKARVRPTSGRYDSIAPDLAVEIASPRNTAADIAEKIDEYFAFGVRLVWVVYAKTRKVYVYTSPKTVTILGMGDTLDGDSVVPGFTLPLADLFGNLTA